MKISLNWLNEFVDVREFHAKPEALAKILTDAGLEVDGYEDLAKPFANVVVGQIRELTTHPNADKLTLCKVDVGEPELRQIVCGAKNHRAGDKVIAALPGAVLPGDFAIKISKIRDVESQGMLCSEQELGLADEKEESKGIVILPGDTAIGLSAADYFGFNDILFEINVTPNRADCLSHLGLAREISGLLNVPLKLPPTHFTSGKDSVRMMVDVELKNSDLCPRYASRVVVDVKIGPSPKWLKTRIEKLGLNSVNNVVDVTNYVMLEMGQPLHAFDLKTLQGKKIIIDRAVAGEKFTSLDGSEFELSGEELTIRSSSGPVALAGVVGGVNSGVKDTTSTLFVESAHFNPKSVRRTARKHGIQTDSAYRYSRGTDPEGVLLALDRACHLIQQVAGGTVTSDHYDCYPQQSEKPVIRVEKSTLETRLGYSVAMEDFNRWMERIHCGVSAYEGYSEVTPPSFRWDISMEVDLIEEYARLHGYQHIPETFPVLATKPTGSTGLYAFENRVANILAGNGFLQAVNHNFLSSEWIERVGRGGNWNSFGLNVPGAPVPILNPLSAETAVMRTHLCASLLRNVAHNLSHGNLRGAYFEIGSVFSKSAAENAGDPAKRYFEERRVTLAFGGEDVALWKGAKVPAVFVLKGVIESLLAKLQATGYQWRNVDSTHVPSIFHPYQTVGLFYQGQMMGVMGTLHPKFCDEMKFKVPYALAELQIEKLMVGQPRVAKFKSISKFQAIERDLSFVVPDTIGVGDLQKEISKALGAIAQSVFVFDEFKGGAVPAGSRSLTFRMVIQALDKTLTEDEINKAMASVLAALEKKFSIKLK